jgi:hypothetical protein
VAVPSAVKVTFTEVELGLTTVGVPRAANVVTAVEVAEAEELPPPLGVTLYEYDVLLVSPVTVQL